MPREGFFQTRAIVNLLESITGYLRESLEELRHVRWPTRNQAIRLSAIVLGFTIASALVFGAFDFLLSEIMNFLLSFA